MDKIWSMVFSFVLIIVATNTGAQDFDLIVTIKGDSIACRIDSITETYVYYEMKSQYHWTHTRIGLEEVSHYEQNVIKKGQYLYEPGTTIIKSEYTDTLPKNAFYIGIMTLTYARTFTGNLVKLTLAGGVAHIDAIGVLMESTLLIGGPSHFFEPGIMAWHIFPSNSSSEGDGSTSGISIRIGYRFQSREGFLFRAAPMIGIVEGGLVLLPALSIGYSF
jgi:hypothetical protein